MKTITFIGYGNMALSIAKGLKENYKLEVVGRNLAKMGEFEKEVGISMQKHLLDEFNVEGKTLLLCVKPANVDEVASKITNKPQALYSVLAGVTLEKLQTAFQTTNVVRAMPNLAASVGESLTTLTGEMSLQKEALNIFNAIGQTRWLSSQKEIDIATALAGSGPAYLALIAEALADGAVKQGLKRDDAMAIMRGLFKGFGELIADEHPALLKDKVMSPGGTTAAGYAALENGGVRAGCIDAIEQAYKKAVELS